MVGTDAGPQCSKPRNLYGFSRRKDRVELFFSSVRFAASVDRSQTGPSVARLIDGVDQTSGSTTLAGLPDQLLHKLQSVLNAAA